jgi:hypothetical protein
VPGNHDVSEGGFTLQRFEQVYGPSMFTFEYGRCLFIVLRVLEAPASNTDSIAFLKRLSPDALARYRHRFVLMHIPPVISRDIQSRRLKESGELMGLFQELGIDYVFTGDYHGYARVTRGRTSYLVTGGGGARLDGGRGRQFHHAVMLHVGRDFVAEKIIPVDRHIDPREALTRFATVRFMPWVSGHRGAAAVLNGLGALCLTTFLALRAPPPRG